MADDLVAKLRAAARTGDMPLGKSFDCDYVADEIEFLLRMLEVAQLAKVQTNLVYVEEIKKLSIALHLAAGMLSSFEPYDHMSPDQMYEFLRRETQEAGND